jgi:REP element-mobilizing transposase RayT
MEPRRVSLNYIPARIGRRSIRLPGYDYSQEGAYFVTIVTKDRQYHFGNIVGEEMQLSRIGEIAEECWKGISKHFPNALVDEFVAMPNHIHGIVILNEHVGVQHVEPLRHRYQKIIPGSISTIVRSFKAAVTKSCRDQGFDHFRWQRNFYEHIIRDDDDLNRIREYILNNPLQWSLDSSREIPIERMYPRNGTISRDKENSLRGPQKESR